MISRRTSSIPKEDVVFPTLLYCDSRCSPRLVTGTLRLVVSAPSLVTGAPRCFLGHLEFSPVLRGVLKHTTLSPMVLLYQSSEITVTPKAGRNALPGSDNLLKLTHLSLHSTSSQTLLETPSDYNTLCWWCIENRVKSPQVLVWI